MITFKNVSFSYEVGGQDKTIIKNVNLHIKKGECAVLCGKSGCGKTTLLRMMNGLIPHFYQGKYSGDIWIRGENMKNTTLPELAKVVGSVFQNPKTQFFHLNTTSELAFSMENQGIHREEMKRRIAHIAEKMGLSKILDCNIFELSGGEKQRVACGAVYAADSEIIILDEPSSNLDMGSIQKLSTFLKEMKQAGKTIVISEHRLWYLWEIADSYYYMENGEISQKYNQEKFADLAEGLREKMGLRAVCLEQIYKLSNEGVKIAGIGKESMENAGAGKEKEKESMKNAGAERQKGIEIKNLVCRRKGRTVLDIPQLAIPKGAIVSIIGENGAGKSTLCNCLAGLVSCKGRLFVEGNPIEPKKRTKHSYLVMQEAGQQLFCESVREEMMLKQEHLTKQFVDAVAEQLNLTEHMEMHPAVLSGGQKQRVVLGTAICGKRKLLLYDEPTSGQDGENLKRTAELIVCANENASVSMIVTHDPEFILRCSTHLLHIENGCVKQFLPLDKEGITYMWNVFNEKERYVLC